MEALECGFEDGEVQFHHIGILAGEVLGLPDVLPEVKELTLALVGASSR